MGVGAAMFSGALAKYEQEHEFARQILLPEEERLALRRR